MSLRLAVLICVSTFALSGCGGTKLIKNAAPLSKNMAQSPVLANATDASLTANLDWVVVRNGPGAWAKNADWDEYLLQLNNTSNQSLQITAVSVVDSLNQTNASQNDRKTLVKASKQNTKRYKQSGLTVKAGMSGTGLATTGLGVGLGAGGAAAAGGGIASGFAGAYVFAAIAPTFAVAGIVRAVRNGKVNKEIVKRQTVLPLSISPGQKQSLDLFFPLAPSPGKVQITYRDAQGEHHLDIDTRQALSGLHLPAQPGEANANPAAASK